MGTTIKIPLEFTDEELIKIDKLKHRLELDNNAVVIAFAISLLISLTDNLDKGYKIKVESSKSVKSNGMTMSLTL